MSGATVFDQTLYQGAAAYYSRGRPTYSRMLPALLAQELRLDGTGCLLDVGCGPGFLTLALAPLFARAVGLDPDHEMLAEAGRRAANHEGGTLAWVQARAEELPIRVPGGVKLVTFGTSFHWTDRARVAEVVYDVLAPGGALALIEHQVQGRPVPAGPPYPPIPHAAIEQVIDRYLGPVRRAGQGLRVLSPEPHETVLRRTRFGPPQRLFVPGRADLVRDSDQVVAGYFSMSFATPRLFGDRRAAFEAEVRATLLAHSASGRFWEWPGDTAVLLVRKPR